MTSNTLTMRKYFLWTSQWYCDYNYYYLLFEDIKLTNYLQSIFYLLKYPTSNFIIKRHVYKIIIQSTFYVYFFIKKFLNRRSVSYFIKRHKRYLINHFLFKKSVYFTYASLCRKLYFFFTFF